MHVSIPSSRVGTPTDFQEQFWDWMVSIPSSRVGTQAILGELAEVAIGFHPLKSGRNLRYLRLS